jgi:hypothetical protein
MRPRRSAQDCLGFEGGIDPLTNFKTYSSVEFVLQGPCGIPAPQYRVRSKPA